MEFVNGISHNYCNRSSSRKAVTVFDVYKYQSRNKHVTLTRYGGFFFIEVYVLEKFALIQFKSTNTTKRNTICFLSSRSQKLPTVSNGVHFSETMVVCTVFMDYLCMFYFGNDIGHLSRACCILIAAWLLSSHLFVKQNTRK